MTTVPIRPVRAILAFVCTVAACCVWPSSLQAQTAPAPSVSAAESIVRLSPFTVTTARDEGYVASATLAGGRLNTAIEDTAASISIFTQEFLRDIGATSLTEAARWAPNTTNAYRDEPSPFNDYQVNIRNLGRSYQTSRNYFRYYGNPDAFFTERIDFGRGPNSLVFGDTGVAGAFNTSTKRAHTQPRTRLEAQTFSHGGHRFGIDINRPLTDAVEARAVLLTMNRHGWQDRERMIFDGAAFTANYRPRQGSMLWVEAEYNYRKNQLMDTVIDQFSRWDGTTTVNAPLSANLPFVTGISRLTNNHRVFNTAQPELGFVNWQNFGQTFGTGIKMAPEGWDAPPGWGLPADARRPVPSSPRFGYNHNFPGVGFNNRLRGLTAVFEHRLSDRLFMEVGVNRVWSETLNQRFLYRTRDLRVDINRNLPNGQPNPNFGKLYSDAYEEAERQFREPLEGRASVAFVDEWRWMEIRGLVGINYRDDRFDVMRYRTVDFNFIPVPSNIANDNNRIWFRRYEHQLDAPFFFPEGTGYIATTASFRTNKTNRGYNVALANKWLESRRLVTFVGYRFENLRDNSPQALSSGNNGVFTHWGPKRITLNTDAKPWNASAVYKVAPWLSVYGAYAESFEYTSGGSFDIAGNDLPVIGAEGAEFGARFRLFEGRVNLSVARYDNRRTNQRTGGESGNINAIYDLLNQGTGADYSARRVETGYSDVFSWQGTGWEFEAVANPTRNLRLMANLAVPSARQIDGFVQTKAYVEANRSFWQSELAKLHPVNDAGLIALIQNRIANVENRLTGFNEGRKLNDSYRYTANVFGNYSVREGRLAGWSGSLGAQFRGKRIVGNRAGAPFDYIYGDGYTTLTAGLGYARSIRGGQLVLRANVSNLLDDPQPAVTNGFWGNVTYTTVENTQRTVFLPRFYTIVPPREITITASYEF